MLMLFQTAGRPCGKKRAGSEKQHRNSNPTYRISTGDSDSRESNKYKPFAEPRLPEYRISVNWAMDKARGIVYWIKNGIYLFEHSFDTKYEAANLNV